MKISKFLLKFPSIHKIHNLTRPNLCSWDPLGFCFFCFFVFFKCIHILCYSRKWLWYNQECAKDHGQKPTWPGLALFKKSRSPSAPPNPPSLSPQSNNMSTTDMYSTIQNSYFFSVKCIKFLNLLIKFFIIFYLIISWWINTKKRKGIIKLKTKKLCSSWFKVRLRHPSLSPWGLTSFFKNYSFFFLLVLSLVGGKNEVIAFEQTYIHFFFWFIRIVSKVFTETYIFLFFFRKKNHCTETSIRWDTMRLEKLPNVVQLWSLTPGGKGGPWWSKNIQALSPTWCQ